MRTGTPGWRPRVVFETSAGSGESSRVSRAVRTKPPTGRALRTMVQTTTTSRYTVPTRRFRAFPRAVWFGARARNAMQRPLLLVGAGATAFATVLIAYVLLPAGARGMVNLLGTGPVEWRDTTALLARSSAAEEGLAAADSALRLARARLQSALAPPAPPRLAPEVVARRDSLSQIAGALGILVRRAENAPLPETYRALGESSSLRADLRVRALLDSLAEITGERDALGGGAMVDPIFVALTSQANAYGRSIQGIGEERLDALQREIARLQAPPRPALPDTVGRILPDTMEAAVVRRESALAVAAAQRALAQGRAANLAATAEALRERERTQLAPLPILLVGATIIAVALAFALALVLEMRSPRVADAAEAERLTAHRVVATARLRRVPVERARRASDRALPPLLDPTFDAYRILAWHLTAQWPKDGVITLTGDQPMVVATVAANLAAVLANDARITLLVDADLDSEPVRVVLGLSPSPGLAAVLENRRVWSEALVSVPVGRSRSLEVLPSGSRRQPAGPAESDALVDEIRRAARRHDATVIVTSLAGVKRAHVGEDVIVCATQTRTRLATLARTVTSLLQSGARVRGVVLWDGALPDPLRADRDRGGQSDTPRAA